ncbi:MAG: Na+/H+ antiporter NhaA [Paramuribaculum sp.]
MATNEQGPDQQTNKGYHIMYSAAQAIKGHASGGNLLILATVLALIIANIPGINQYYIDFWNQEVRLQVGDFNVFSHGGEPMSVLDFINDALMAIFFFSVGLEIKREMLVGERSSSKQALLPIMGACGGMLFPVLIFFALAAGTDYVGGAAIPMATDIAFSIGVLAMLGSRCPVSLKVFLTTLAVADDIGGIIVIATCYSTHLELMFLVYAAILLGVLLLGSAIKIKSKMFYILVGMVVWFLFLNSGIHPTIAGVLVAFCVPATPLYPPKKYVQVIRKVVGQFDEKDDDQLADRCTILDKERMNRLKEIESASDKVISPLQDLEDTLHPLVNYIIIPLFAFANAGIFLLGLDPATIIEGVSLAIILGLVVGKFAGIFAFTWLTVKLGWAPMPSESNWKMVASVSMLGGIGFTVSLFIANLSFGAMGAHGMDLLNHAKLGIVIGSLLSGVLGYIMLSRTLPHTTVPDEYEEAGV